MRAVSFQDISAKTPEELFALCETQASGISAEQAQARLREYGMNALAGKDVPWWSVAARQFRSAFVYLLFAASLVALALQEYADAGFIALFLLVNTTLGFIQEFRAEKALKLLKHFVRKKARVKRGGVGRSVPMSEIVPGDIVLLRAGDTIPADGYFLRAENISVDESPLTGESLPSEKASGALPKPAANFYEAKNIGFSQTTLVSGGGELAVFATGSATAIGSIASAIARTHAQSGFEIGISRFSSFILRLVFITVPIVFLANFFVHRGAFHIGEFLLFSIALTVSVIPEALPLVTTLAISQGALRLARMHVVPRRLSAIEDLGSIQVLCTDKTGTLTKNELTVAEIFGNKEAVIEAGLRASAQFAEMPQSSANVFDRALKGEVSNAMQKRFQEAQVVQTAPFDPLRRRESAIIREANTDTLFVRGALESLALGVSVAQRSELHDWMRTEGRKGRRVLTVARKALSPQRGQAIVEEEDGLSFVGLVSFLDPLKETAKQAIQDAETLGIRIKILTGDSREVAGQVAYEAGIINDPADVMTGDEFEELSLKEKYRAVKDHDVFARTLPLQKYEIIQLLQESALVGFLGEGFNDAPALKLAHVALAVEGASDIAQDASDIILLNQSLEVIVDGIREGRKIFANTLKYIKATLTSNFGNFYTLSFASLVIKYLPMLPVQILLLNLLSDFPMMSIATDAVDDEELKRPRGYNIREIALLAIVLGLVSTSFDFMFFGFFVRYGERTLQTMWFLGSIFTELVLLFSIRTAYVFFKARRPSMFVVIPTVLVAILAVVLPFSSWGQHALNLQKPSPFFLEVMFALVVLYFVSTEIVKLMVQRFLASGARATVA